MSRVVTDVTGAPAVVVAEQSVAVSVVAFYGPTIAAVLDQIEQAVRPLIADRTLQVTIEDLDISGPSSLS